MKLYYALVSVILLEGTYGSLRKTPNMDMTYTQNGQIHKMPVQDNWKGEEPVDWSVSEDKRKLIMSGPSKISYDFNYKVTPNSVIQYIKDSKQMESSPSMLCLKYKDETALCHEHSQGKMQETWKVGLEKIGDTTGLIMTSRKGDSIIGDLKVHETMNANLFGGCMVKKNTKTKLLKISKTFDSCRAQCTEDDYDLFSFYPESKECQCVTQKQNKRVNLFLSEHQSKECDCVKQSTSSGSMCVYHVQQHDSHKSMKFATGMNGDEDLQEDIDKPNKAGPSNLMIRTNKGKFSDVRDKLIERGILIVKEISAARVISVVIPPNLKENADTLKAMPGIDRVEDNAIGLEQVRTNDALPLGIHDVVRHRTLQEDDVPPGVEIVLQDLDFWNNLEPPSGSVKVCIVDSGYEANHTGLPQYVTGSDDESWNTDEHGDGTRIAGIIAGVGDSRGIIDNDYGGNFELVVVKALADGTGSWDSVIQGVEDCVSLGATVISTSFVFGATGNCQIAREVFQELYDENDVIFVGMAGDFGDQLVYATTYNYPASFESVISVAAVDGNEAYAEFSTYNDQVELLAPGMNVRTTTIGGSYDSYNGTSVAVPHVAGVAGLLRMFFPQCANYQIRNVLAATAKQPEDLPCCTDYYGHGIVKAKDAYELLAEGNCGGDLGSESIGGCGQLDIPEECENINSDEEEDCETRIPNSHLSREMFGLGCIVSGNCCENEFCCMLFGCTTAPFECNPMKQKHESCAYDFQCYSDRCTWVMYQKWPFDVRKVCWDQPVGLDEPCERGADCTTGSCNNETKKCGYLCIPGQPEVEAGNGEGVSVSLNGIEKGLCTDDERCGDTVLSVLSHACEPKYELGSECEIEQDCISGHCRGPYIHPENEPPYQIKTCRVERFEDGVACNDEDDCVSDFCSPVTGLCAALCDEHSDCGDDGYCVTGMYCDPKLADGSTCISGDYCASGRCDYDSNQERICKAKLAGGEKCMYDADCTSNSCPYNTELRRFACELTDEEKLHIGDDCTYSEQCLSGRCHKRMCRRGRVELGGECQDEHDCPDDDSIHCVDNICKKRCYGTSSDCPEDGYGCFTSREYPYYCDAQQEAGASCGAGTECISGNCRGSNRSTLTCRDPPAELGGSCVDSYGCGAGARCSENSCKETCPVEYRDDSCSQDNHYCASFSSWEKYCEPKLEVSIRNLYF